MARIFTENSNRDIFTNSSNQISISSGLTALIQSAKSAMELQLGEAIYAIGQGIPTEATVWDGTPNLQQFEFAARKQLKSISGINEISEFDAEIDGDKMKYTATIKTVFGEGVISGSI